jgi:hypothetical protein
MRGAGQIDGGPGRRRAGDAKPHHRFADWHDRLVHADPAAVWKQASGRDNNVDTRRPV